MIPKCLALYGSEDASTMYRVFQPYTALQRLGYTADFAPKDADGLALAHALYGYNTICTSRLSWPKELLPKAEAWIDRFHQQNLMVIADCDDDQWTHIGDHLTHEADAERLAVNLQSVDTLRLVDGVTVSTPRLATVVRSLTDAPVAVVPNLLDIAWFDGVQAQARRVVGKGLTIGWAGAKRQESDFAPVAEAWGRIAARYPDVRFVVAGWQPDALRGAVPAERLTLLPWVAIQDYPKLLVNIDIMCCPLADTPFNRCKSIIKSLEAGATGCAVVASPTLYREIIRDYDTGFLARDADEWTAHLSRLVEDAELRTTLARRLRRAVVERYDLGQRAEEVWIGAWSWLRQEWEARKEQAA